MSQKITKSDIKIAAILSEYKVVINAGKRDGVEKGDSFLILDKNGRVIKDPDTGNVLGTFPGYKGKIEVIKVEEKFSYCETPIYYRSGLAELALSSTRSITNSLESFATLTDELHKPIQDKLIVDDDDIINLESKYTDTPVKVGDDVEKVE